MQSQRWEGTDLDVARHIKVFPPQMHEGELKYPTVVRGALKVIGVGVGFDAEARAGIIMAQVKAHEDKLKVLERLTPLLGRQTSELFGRFSCKPSTTFNHQARGNEPSISRVPLEHAGEMQAHLFRTITHRPRRDPRRAARRQLRRPDGAAVRGGDAPLATARRRWLDAPAARSTSRLDRTRDGRPLPVAAARGRVAASAAAE